MRTMVFIASLLAFACQDSNFLDRSGERKEAQSQSENAEVEEPEYQGEPIVLEPAQPPIPVGGAALTCIHVPSAETKMDCQIWEEEAKTKLVTKVYVVPEKESAWERMDFETLGPGLIRFDTKRTSEVYSVLVEIENSRMLHTLMLDDSTNLLIDGGFEALTDSDDSIWIDAFIPVGKGWQSRIANSDSCYESKTYSIQSNRMRIWNSFDNDLSFEGQYFVEIPRTCSSVQSEQPSKVAYFQDIFLKKGQSYLLSFSYRNNESEGVAPNLKVTLTQAEVFQGRPQTTSWEHVSVVVVPATDNNRLEFLTTGVHNGIFLDDVRIVEMGQKPVVAGSAAGIGPVASPEVSSGDEVR